MSEVVIAGAACTPVGAFDGGLAPLPAARLGAIGEALRRAAVAPEEVDQVVLGHPNHAISWKTVKHGAHGNRP